MGAPPGPWQGQNTAIYRTGATWASKWPLGPARDLVERPAGPFGPVSALPGHSKCRSVTHQNSAIYCTGATWASKWPLGPAWVLLECPAGPFEPVSALPRRSKWPLKPFKCSHLAFEIASQACPGAGGAPGRPIGFVLALPGCSKWLLRAASVPEKAFRLLKHCYR